MSGKKRVRHSLGQIVEKLQEADRLLGAGQSLGQMLQALPVASLGRIKQAAPVRCGLDFVSR